MSLKILFMGTPAFSVPCLKALLSQDCEVVGVVSQPDRPKGRGRKLQATPIAAVAREYGLPLFQWKRLNNESFNTLKELNPDLCVVVAYGKILPSRYLKIPRLGCWNVHASVLPQLRGAAPIQWALIEGFEVTGVSLMQLDEGMDTGPVALVKTIEIEPTETASDLHDKLSVLGAQALTDGLKSLRANALEFRAQNHSQATHARPLTKSDGHLEWSLSAREIWLRYRGLTPWPSCSVQVKDERVKLVSIRPETGHGVPGTVLKIDEQTAVVACGDGAVRLIKVQRPNRGPVSGAEFMRALGLQSGERLV